MMRLLFVAVVTLCACGSDEPSSSPSPLGDASDVSTALDAGPTVCPSGHVLGPDGECMAVGIQGCDGMFIDPDTGLCDPTSDHCPPGQIPIFSGDDQGCQKVGILDCHPDFIDVETGLCDPSPDACGDGFIPVPTQGCVSLDPPGGCGEGTWGNVEELAGDVYVDVNYVGGDSDGTREKPWSAISVALANVTSGGRVVLAAGIYDEGLWLYETVSLVGRCSSMVTLSGTRVGAVGPTVVEAQGPAPGVGVDIAISDVRISGSAIGLSVHSGVRMDVQRVRFEDNKTLGIVVGGADTEVRATDVLVARSYSTSEDPPGAPPGGGISVQLGATLTLTRASLESNDGIGLYAGDAGTTVAATDVLISRTEPVAHGTLGWGIAVQEGVHLTLERAAITDNHDVGLLALSDATVTATEVLIARTQPLPDGTGGLGISFQTGANLTLERAAVTENRDIAIAFAWAGGSVTSSLLQGTKLSPANLWGVADGLLVTGSVVTATGVVARGNARAGILYDRSEGDISSCLITDNAIGLANQGLPGATVADDNVVTGNEQNFLDDGDLEVPDEAMSLPEF